MHNESIRAIKSGQIALSPLIVSPRYKQKKNDHWYELQCVQLYGRACCLKLKFNRRVEEVNDMRQSATINDVSVVLCLHGGSNMPRPQAVAMQTPMVCICFETKLKLT